MIEKCPINDGQCPCEFDEVIDYQTQYSDKDSIEKPKKIKFCKKCSLGIADPLVSQDDLDKYYNEGIYWGDTKEELFSFKKYPVPYVLAKARWELIASCAQQQGKAIKSVLDVGAGHGYLGMYASKSTGIDTYHANEADDLYLKSLTSTWDKLKIPAQLETSKFLDNVDGKYDVVVLSHIMEHLRCPADMLKDVLKRLNPGGYVLIDVPYRDYKYKKDIFPHLMFFGPTNMKQLAENLSLKTIHVDTYGPDYDQAIVDLGQNSQMSSLWHTMIYKLRWFAPLSVVEHYFSSQYKVNQINANGIWLRALLQS